jgi:glycerophosphoryl diester phosphodiesterase
VTAAAAVISGPTLSDLPAVIGHRGAAALAPENTISGFRAARAAGVSWVEFDVRLAGDGRCVLLHDDTVDRTTDGSGRAADMSVEALRRLDAGSWFAPRFAGEPVPTFEEAIDAIGELEFGANIEIKTGPGAAAETGRTVARIAASRWPPHLPPPLLSSFSEAALAAAREAAPELPRGILFGVVPRDWRRRADRLGCVTVHVDHRRIDSSLVADIIAAGFPILAYTVNEINTATRLRVWGVSSIITDHPDRLAPTGVAGMRA